MSDSANSDGDEGIEISEGDRTFEFYPSGELSERHVSDNDLFDFQAGDCSFADNSFRDVPSLSDFRLFGSIGYGNSSSVVLAECKKTHRKYAVKVISKQQAVLDRVVDYVRGEIQILRELDYDGICKLHFAFQSQESLYMGLELCPGGELFALIQKSGRLPLDTTRMFTAEIVLMLEHLRAKNIVHRDLKPENLVLSATGHLKLIDFGSAKVLPAVYNDAVPKRTSSMVGTAGYVSPEVLLNGEVTYSADLWALGCIIFKMLAGRSPFKATTRCQTFQKVLARDFRFPNGFPVVARDLVDRLLVMDPAQRLGAMDLTELKMHPYFARINWSTLRSSSPPPLLPRSRPSAIKHELNWGFSDTSNLAAVMKVVQTAPL